MDATLIPEVLAVHPPTVEPLPLVLDSPHSGNHYPADFAPALAMGRLAMGEDRFVDELVADAPQHGAPLLRALFPRVYLDPNRDETDLDPALLAEDWPDALSPTEKSRVGMGLIWRLLGGETPIYARKLTVAEVKRRLVHYYWPYHRHLQELLDGAYEGFQGVWHLNCHSMPSVSSVQHREGVGVARPDITLADGVGRTCEPDFIEFLRERLVARGYEVKLNDPYRGATLVHRYADPAQNRHSLMIEINRRLYMDEATLARNDNFPVLYRDLGEVIGELADFVRERTAGA